MPSSDDRVTLKIDRKLWKTVDELIKSHPEWGIISVPEFVRRAIDSEIRARAEAENSRVVTLCFSPESEDSHRRAP